MSPDINAENGKALATLQALFALAGYQLQSITKESRAHFEVRCSGQCHACSTLHDLRGFLAQIKDGNGPH